MYRWIVGYILNKIAVSHDNGDLVDKFMSQQAIRLILSPIRIFHHTAPNECSP